MRFNLAGVWFSLAAGYITEMTVCVCEIVKDVCVVCRKLSVMSLVKYNSFSGSSCKEEDLMTGEGILGLYKV